MDAWDAFKILGISNPDGWESIGYVNDANMKFAVGSGSENNTDLFKEVTLSNTWEVGSSLHTWEAATPISVPPFKVLAEIKDENGKTHMLPLSEPPNLEINYSYDGQNEMVIHNPGIVIEALHQYSPDGSIHVIKGPFTVKGSYLQQWQPQKIVGFDYGPMKTAPSPSPFSLNEEPKKHVDSATFSWDWMEELECCIIGGYHEKKRYEVILGQATTLQEILGLFPEDGKPPAELVSLISRCLVALRKHQDEKKNVLAHEKLHGISVVCPGNGQKLPNVAFGSACKDHLPINLYDLIQHLNDIHRWSREAIAEWIDTLEEQPVFYPIIESGRVANSAKVVKVK